MFAASRMEFIARVKRNGARRRGGEISCVEREVCVDSVSDGLVWPLDGSGGHVEQLSGVDC